MSFTQMEELQDPTFLDEKSKSSQGKRNPPARATSRFWFERFLAVIQRQNPSAIDATFLSQIAPSNEGKLLSQLKFLHVIDEQGKPTLLLATLNMVGEEQKKGFQQIARRSYQDLFSEVKIDKAVPDDLVNFFIRKYAYTRDKALNASKFFLYLTEKGAIPVSPELSGFLSEKSNGTTAQNGSSQTVVQRAPRAPVAKPPQRRHVTFEEPLIQATVNIRLDKDTPKEYWDRVFALLGERKVELTVSAESENGKPEDETES